MNIEQIKQARMTRKSFKSFSNYGIAYLDDCLGGISEDDFVLIGAESGTGKTELGINIAVECGKNHKVHLFALEAEKDEPIHRTDYKVLADLYFKDTGKKKIQHIDYRNYILNKVDLGKYETPETIEKVHNMFKNIEISYREGSFTVADLTKKMGEIKDDCEIIIVDHVDYFDFDDKRDENTNMTELMKQLRNINQVYRIPVIAISHLRKKSDYKQVIPTLEDFIGSSNKYKQVKTAILFAPNYEDTNYETGLFGTYMTVAKSRTAPKSNIVASIVFNANKNTYSPEYDLYKVKDGGRTLEKLSEESKPYWAKKKTLLSDDVPFN
jgi:replicative DNA helicase